MGENLILGIGIGVVKKANKILVFISGIFNGSVKILGMDIGVQNFGIAHVWFATQ